MAIDVELPALGESVTEGTITGWLVSVGDTVTEDQPLFELSSDKIDTEVPSPASGTVLEILVQVDETVEIGTVVARIGASDEASDSSSDQPEGSGTEGAEAAEDDQQASSGGPADAPPEDQASADVAEGSDGDQGADPGADEDKPQAEGDKPTDGVSAGAAGQGEVQDSGGGASVDVTLPELGESVTEGTITAWLVSVGDEVAEDQPLFELSSDKIDTEVPSPAAGTVSEILVEVDETVEVGTVVARLGSASGKSGGSAAEQNSSPQAEGAADQPGEQAAEPSTDSGQATSAPGRGAEGPSASTPAGPETLASPLVRSLARDNDIALSKVEGTGQGGRITREDVQGAIDGGTSSGASAVEPSARQASGDTASSSSAPAGSGAGGASSGGKPAADKAAGTPRQARAAGERERVEDISRIRQRIADKMLESQREAAQLTTVQEVDVTALMGARGKAKDAFQAREGVSLSPFAMIARAAILAVRDHPTVNAYADWDSGKLYLRDYVNLGIAVDTPKGLLVPNVKGADSLTVAGLARGIVEAAEKARGENGRRLDFSDIEGGTFTLTNTGSRGVLIDTPILNYPEVAILGVGAIVKRPAVVTGPDGTESIGIRQMMYLSLTYDHRLLDGADAARYVTDVKHVLEDTDWAQEIGG